MKKFLWRRVILPCTTFTSVVLLLVAFRNLIQTHEDSEEQGLTPQKLKLILKHSEELNRERIEQIEATCKKYNLGIYKDSSSASSIRYPPTPQYSVFYIDRVHKIAYCPIYKAGSTTWLYNLLTLNGVKESSMKGKQMSEVARQSFPEVDAEDAEKLVKESKLLMCVRHPFDRILSAYRDKLEDRNRAPEHGTLHYYKRWGKRIRNKYRKTGPLEPTFQEFVRYLIDTDLMQYADDHWIPYNAYCTPCYFRYSQVAAVETLTSDQLLFISSLEDPASLKPNRRHSSGKISSQVAKEYFSQLTKHQINQLYEKFSLDFHMFQYNISKYLEYATD